MPTGNEYKFAATLKKLGLSVAHEKDEAGETVDVPRLTITLEIQDQAALGVNARLSSYHGNELVIVVDGYAHQLMFAE